MRIAWIGAAPGERGGVPGVARQLQLGLVEQGIQIDAYVSDAETLPNSIRSSPAITVIDAGGLSWKWGKWYSNSPIASFISGSLARAQGQHALTRRLLFNHSRRPYDLIYQFSNIEMFGLHKHLGELPPLVLHPQTHMAGELRHFILERPLRRRCESPLRSAPVRAALQLRSSLQARHASVARMVICASPPFRQLLMQDYGLKAPRTVVIPNPVDLDPAERNTAADMDGRQTALYVGRFSSRKGIDTLVKLSHRLSDMGDSLRLRLIGYPTLWSDYSPLLGRMDPKMVVIDGAKVHYDPRQALADADVLLQPATYEPFGLTVAEALISGTPVVGTEAVGSLHFLRGPAVRIVPTNDLDAFEEATRGMLAATAGHRSEMATAAREGALSAFDAQAVTEKLAAVLHSIAGC